MEDVHVMPVNDNRNHKKTSSCWCNPESIPPVHDEAHVFIHNDAGESENDKIQAVLDDLYAKTVSIESEVNQKCFRDTMMYLRTALIALREARHAFPVDVLKTGFQAVNSGWGS